MAWQIPVMLGASLLGGIFSNRQGVAQQNQNQSFNNTTNFDQQGNTTGYGRTTPTYDPAAWDFRNELMGRVLSRPDLQDPRMAAQSMTTSGMQNLNMQSDLQRKAIESMMQQRGLGHSPMGGTMMGNFDANRIQQSIGMLNQQPLLERQFAQENENILNNRQQLAQQLFSMIPFSQENENFQNTWGAGTQNQFGTSNMQGYTTNPANKLGGAFGNFANTLAGLYGSGAFGGGGASAPTPGGINPNYRLPQPSLGGFGRNP